MLGLVQHVFQPVSAVGNLDREPFGHILFHTAVPVGAKSQDITIEVILGILVIHEKAYVDHVDGRPMALAHPTDVP